MHVYVCRRARESLAVFATTRPRRRQRRQSTRSRRERLAARLLRLERDVVRLQRWVHRQNTLFPTLRRARLRLGVGTERTQSLVRAPHQRIRHQRARKPRNRRRASPRILTDHTEQILPRRSSRRHRLVLARARSSSRAVRPRESVVVRLSAQRALRLVQLAAIVARPPEQVPRPLARQTRPEHRARGARFACRVQAPSVQQRVRVAVANRAQAFAQKYRVFDAVRVERARRGLGERGLEGVRVDGAHRAKRTARGADDRREVKMNRYLDGFATVFSNAPRRRRRTG